MNSNKSKQLFITSYDYPLDSIKTIFFNDKTFDMLCKNENFFIKKFLGSDWFIIGSGFIFQGPNKINIVFNINYFEKNSFNIIHKFSITYINGIQINNNLKIILSLINNTLNHSTLVELRLEFQKEWDLIYINDIINLSIIEKIFSQFCSKINSLLKSSDKNNMDKNDFIVINHSFIIKKYYKNAFDFFYNWNNIAKSIKTDKIWKIINENEIPDNTNYKNFSIIINENTKIHYRVISINEKKDEKIEILYNKTGNSFPALNDYIKFSFFNISKEICFFLYETHLPINITSSLFQTISQYVYYCNKKSKKYLENQFNE